VQAPRQHSVDGRLSTNEANPQERSSGGFSRGGGQRRDARHSSCERLPNLSESGNALVEWLRAFRRHGVQVLGSFILTIDPM
jgi:hypothetical protein